MFATQGNSLATYSTILHQGGKQVASTFTIRSVRRHVVDQGINGNPPRITQIRYSSSSSIRIALLAAQCRERASKCLLSIPVHRGSHGIDLGLFPRRLRQLPGSQEKSQGQRKRNSRAAAQNLILAEQILELIQRCRLDGFASRLIEMIPADATKATDAAVTNPNEELNLS